MFDIQALSELVENINFALTQLSVSDSLLDPLQEKTQGLRRHENFVQERIRQLDTASQKRIENEYFGYGPIEPLIDDPSISEIMINAYNSIWIERHGGVTKFGDNFLSELTYQNFMRRLYLEMGQEPSLPFPFLDSHWKNMRVHVIMSYSQNLRSPILTLRKPSTNPWTIERLFEHRWCNHHQLNLLKGLVSERKNIITIGPTGSGKTSITEALLRDCKPEERVVILEDSSELSVPNEVSIKLLTRNDSQQVLTEIDLNQLVKQALRMRPDRLVVGEVRGGEAKDLLMALATGHSGSLGTLHASDPHQALVRLEMLIQIGAPNWSIGAIRKLIAMSLDAIVVCAKSPTGNRYLNGIYKLASLEDSGFTLERIDLQPNSEQPPRQSLDFLL